jgi:hypothetical protein
MSFVFAYACEIQKEKLGACRSLAFLVLILISRYKKLNHAQRPIP